MEENSLSHPLKYPHIGTRAIKDCVNDINVMANAELSCNRQSHGEDYVNGFSWPPRSYTCSFCRREFRSAQALGGHMNVHRRDRARLRQSPPSDGQYPVLNVNFNPNPNPNPNPNFSSSSSSPSLSSPSTRLKSFALPLPSLISPTLSSLTSPPFASPGEVKSRASVGSLLDSSRPKSMDVAEMDTEKSFHEAGDVDGFKQEDGCKNLKKTEILRLDLETCPFSDSKGDDLDLELRLGYS